MLNRVLLTAIAFSCTFSSETLVTANAHSTQCAIKDLICVLFLSGIQKEDLDVALLRKLERRNVDLNQLNDEKVRQECFIQYYVQQTEANKSTNDTTLDFDMALKENITKTKLAEIFDSSELEVLLKHLREKHKSNKFIPNYEDIKPINKTETNKENINVEVKSFKYKIEIITQKPEKEGESESDGIIKRLPVLENVIDFWNTYLKSNHSEKPKPEMETPKPKTLQSDEAESISAFIAGYLSKTGAYPTNITNNKIINETDTVKDVMTSKNKTDQLIQKANEKTLNPVTNSKQNERKENNYTQPYPNLGQYGSFLSESESQNNKLLPNGEYIARNKIDNHRDPKNSNALNTNKPPQHNLNDLNQIVTTHLLSDMTTTDLRYPTIPKSSENQEDIRRLKNTDNLNEKVTPIIIRDNTKDNLKYNTVLKNFDTQHVLDDQKDDGLNKNVSPLVLIDNAAKYLKTTPKRFDNLDTNKLRRNVLSKVLRDTTAINVKYQSLIKRDDPGDLGDPKDKENMLNKNVSPLLLDPTTNNLKFENMIKILDHQDINNQKFSREENKNVSPNFLLDGTVSNSKYQTIINDLNAERDIRDLTPSEEFSKKVSPLALMNTEAKNFSYQTMLDSSSTQHNFGNLKYTDKSWTDFSPQILINAAYDQKYQTKPHHFYKQDNSNYQINANELKKYLTPPYLMGTTINNLKYPNMRQNDQRNLEDNKALNKNVSPLVFMDSTMISSFNPQHDDSDIKNTGVLDQNKPLLLKYKTALHNVNNQEDSSDQRNNDGLAKNVSPQFPADTSIDDLKYQRHQNYQNVLYDPENAYDLMKIVSPPIYKDTTGDDLKQETMLNTLLTFLTNNIKMTNENLLNDSARSKTANKKSSIDKRRPTKPVNYPKSSKNISAINSIISSLMSAQTNSKDNADVSAAIAQYGKKSELGDASIIKPTLADKNISEDDKVAKDEFKYLLQGIIGTAKNENREIFKNNIVQSQNILQPVEQPLNLSQNKGSFKDSSVCNSKLKAESLVCTTPIIKDTTKINTDMFLRPEIIKQIAEDVKRMVLNEIQVQMTSTSTTASTRNITPSTIASSVTSPKTTTSIVSTVSSIATDVNYPETTTIITTLPTTFKTTMDPTIIIKEEIPNSTTADMFAATLTKIDSEKLKQATQIIEKFIELFKHIKSMQEIKDIPLTTPPSTEPLQPEDTVESKQTEARLKLPSLMDALGFIPHSVQTPQPKTLSVDMILHPEQKPNPFDFKLQPRKQPAFMPPKRFDIKRPAISLTGPFGKPNNLYKMKVQSAKAMPFFVNSYDPPRPFNPLPFNAPLKSNPITNTSISIQQTDVSSMLPIPIQMLDPVILNQILVRSPSPAMTANDRNRWNTVTKIKSPSRLQELLDRKQTFNTYSNFPNRTKDIEPTAETQQTPVAQILDKNIYNNTPLTALEVKQLVERLIANNGGGHPTPAPKQSKPIPSPQINDARLLNQERLITEIEKLAKVFGSNKDGNNNDFDLKTKNVEKGIDSQFPSTESPLKVETLGGLPEYESRFLKLENLAQLLKGNDKEELFNLMFRKDFSAPPISRTGRTFTSLNKNKPRRNFEDNIKLALSGLKYKRPANVDRPYQLAGSSFGPIPVGYHERLETIEDKSLFKDREWGTSKPVKQMATMNKIKPQSKYNDANFNNFLKTQQKVNKILERILATRTEDTNDARSTETL